MTDRANTYEELKDAISEAYPTLSPQLQRLARYALDKPHDLALATVAAVAEANAVQPSSTIRFANALGFDGFSQMQQVFRSHLVERGAPYRERIKRMAPGPQAAGGVLHQFVDEAVDELRHLEEHVDPNALAAAVRLLAAAPRIHVLAQRRAFPVAAYLAYALNQLELRAHLLDGLGGMLDGFARNIGAGEVLVVASFRNYSPAVVETALAARTRGVSVIAITDSALSPLKSAADVCFELGDDSSRPFRSLVAPLCLAQALVVATGQQLATPAGREEKAARRGGGRKGRR